MSKILIVGHFLKVFQKFQNSKIIAQYDGVESRLCQEISIRKLEWGDEGQKGEGDRLPKFTEVLVILPFFEKKWAKIK